MSNYQETIKNRLMYLCKTISIYSKIFLILILMLIYFITILPAFIDGIIRGKESGYSKIMENEYDISDYQT